MERDRKIVAILSRVAAGMSFLGGGMILAFLVLLTMLWPTRSFLGELVALLREPAAMALLLCAIVAMVLAPFIWRERIWAMLAAMVLSGSLLFLFANETLFLKISLSGATALFAICTAARHWLGRPVPR